MAIPSPSVNDILKIFNGFHPRLQFTVEIGGNQLNFLDVTIIKVNNFLEFNWYHEPTFSGRYLSFSLNTLSQKRGTIMGMVDRVFLFSHPRFYLENLKFVIEILLKNDYPLKFVFNAINSRLKFLLSNRFHRKTNNKDKNC